MTEFTTALGMYTAAGAALWRAAEALPEYESCGCDLHALKVIEPGYSRWTDVVSVPGRVERVIADFHAQAWQRDQAVPVDPLGVSTWDATAFWPTLPADYREQLITKAASGRDVIDDRDSFRSDPSAPAWIAEWSGPFDIHLDLDGVNAGWAAQTDGWDDMDEHGVAEWLECVPSYGGCGKTWRMPEDMEWD